MKLIVGLGNPGNEYKTTRHNVGFMVLDTYLGNVKWSSKFNSLYYETSINGEKYIFIKPQTYMNLSGSAVYSFVNFYKLSYKDILVIHDDLDLPIGKFRIKINSSSGGHNGIKDIISAIHTDAFARIKIGISNDKNKDTKDYVLSSFSKLELNEIENNFKSVYDIIEHFDYDKISDLMSKYN